MLINKFQDFLMCRLCSTRVELYNKVAHQKYLMYIECAKRVTEKRSADPHKDTTVILNELLADESWLSQVLRLMNSWKPYNVTYLICFLAFPGSAIFVGRNRLPRTPHQAFSVEKLNFKLYITDHRLYIIMFILHILIK